MRIIDCKSDICKGIIKDAPRLIDYLCEDCSNHFEKVKSLLENVGITYEIDPDIVRGLDYYTRTVFEITADIESANTTVCGGGRYDGLVEELGGPKTPACGFAIGMERLFLALQSQNVEIEDKSKIDIYVGNIGENNALYAEKIVYELRKKDVSAECDKMARSVKAQMKYANKLGCNYSIIIGDEEVQNGKAMIKNMSLGESTEIELNSQKIAEYINN